jgi:hypothetical protein
MHHTQAADETLNNRPDACAWRLWNIAENLKQAGTLSLVVPRMDSVRRTPVQLFTAPTLWNQIPDNTQRAPSLATFKELLNTYLFHQDD